MLLVKNNLKGSSWPATVREKEYLSIELMVAIPEILSGGVRAVVLTMMRRPVISSSAEGTPIAIMESSILTLSRSISLEPGERRIVESSSTLTDFLPSLSSRIIVFWMMSVTWPM